MYFSWGQKKIVVYTPELNENVCGYQHELWVYNFPKENAYANSKGFTW